MKILLCASNNPRFIELGGYVERALKFLGHRCEKFDFRQFVLPSAIRYRSYFLNKWDLNRLNRSLIKKAAEYRPDILFVIQGQTLFPETISTIKRRFEPMAINWFQDYPKDFEISLKLAPVFNHFFMNDSYGVQYHRNLGNKNVKWLPFACDPQIHRPLNLTDGEKETYSADVVFVGSMNEFRAKALEKLRDFNLAIWGSGWQRLPKNSPLKRFARGGSLIPYEWVKVFNASKIVFNYIGSYNMPSYLEENNMVNMRLFEALGCKAFQLVDCKKDVLTLFVDREDLVCFKDDDEPKDLVKYYLVHSEERKRISENGYRKVLEKHTYIHRMKEVFSYLKI